MSPIAMGVSVVSVCCVCVCVRVCVFVCVTIVGIGHTLPKVKNIKNTFVDFDICHRMTLLRKLFSVTSTYF